MTGFAIAAIFLTSSTSGAGGPWVRSCIPQIYAGEICSLGIAVRDVGDVIAFSRMASPADDGPWSRRQSESTPDCSWGRCLTALGVRLAFTDR
jgi:hypothetical protein